MYIIPYFVSPACAGSAAGSNCRGLIESEEKIAQEARSTIASPKSLMKATLSLFLSKEYALFC